MSDDVKRYVVMNDIQLPFQDGPVLSAVLGFVDNMKPDGVVLNGDVVDCYSISDYDKNPMTRAHLDREIKLAGRLMDQLAKASKGSCLWIGGNHEDRLRRHLWDRAPELGRLPDLSFDSLFKLEDHGFQWKPYGSEIKLGRLVVTHGFIVAQHSGVSAKRHLDRLGVSVLIGHTHRLAKVYLHNRAGVHVGIENGCLCKLTAEYVQQPNWQQGFSVVTVDKNGWFHVTLVEVVNRKFFEFGGERYKV